MIRRLPRFLRNYYFAAGLLFLVWILFLDKNDLVSNFRTTRKVNALQAEKKYYIEKIDEIKKERKTLFGNPELLEKYAREKYLMKKPSEDIYIVEEKKEE